VSSSSGVATSVSELLYPCYFTYFYFTLAISVKHWLIVTERQTNSHTTTYRASMASRGKDYQDRSRCGSGIVATFWDSA